MKKYFLSFTLLLLSLLSFGQKSDKVIGVWLTQDEDSKVTITQNEDGSFNGAVTWLEAPKEADGSSKVDKNNPDTDLKTRQIMGLKLLKNFRFEEDDDEWTDGTIYDPKSGNTYKCYMWFDGNPNKLQVKGYIGFSLIGKKVSWTRVIGES